MNITYFGLLLFGLQLFYWYVGRRAAGRTNEDYFLAGKSVGLFPLTMTFLATQVGGGLLLGAADEAYRFGWSVLFYPLGAALGLVFLGLGIGRRLASFPVSTVAGILEIAYGSSALKKAASALSVISLFMILVGQIVASQKFLASFGIANLPLFIAFWGVVILYTVRGGLKAVISTDIAQATVFIVAFALCLGFCFWGNVPSLPNLGGTSFAIGGAKMWGWLLMPMLFMLIEQDMGQRCFAGKSPRVVSWAAIYAGIGTFLICCVPVALGILARNGQFEIAPGASVLMTAITKTAPAWLSAFAGCAILAAILSTATSLINAIGSNLSSDFNLPGKKITAAISVLAIGAAFSFDNVVDVLLLSYELSVSALFVPIFFALFKKRCNLRSALLSVAAGTAGFCLFRIFPTEFPREALSVALSLAGYFVGEAKGIAENVKKIYTARL